MPYDSALTLLADRHAQLPSTAHIAVLVPWANQIVETELPRLGLDKVVFHYARLVPARRYRDANDFLAEIAAVVPITLEQFTRMHIDGALVACTSVGFITPQAYAHTPVVDAFEAILLALSQLAASRVILATPYPKHHTAKQAETLSARGIVVADHASLDLGLLDDFGAVTLRHIRDLISQMQPHAVASAQALVLSCTAWPTLGGIKELEDELGIPVLSSNLALAITAAGTTPNTEPS